MYGRTGTVFQVACSRMVMLAAKVDLSCAMASVITVQTSRTINIDTKTKPCLIRISIARSTMNLSSKLSNLSRGSIALSFQAATRVYLTGTDGSRKSA